MVIEKYIPGKGMNTAGKAIAKMMEDVNDGRSYADMMRLRISGGVSEECYDTYYSCHSLAIHLPVLSVLYKVLPE